MIRLTIANQRGGVGKTTTVHALGRTWADQGMKVLLIDTDPQGSLAEVLGLKSRNKLHNFLIDNIRLEECVAKAQDNLEVLLSDRTTAQTENILSGRMGKEFALEMAMAEVEQGYDAVLVDVAPSISNLLTCAMIYSRQVLIPVAMDLLSIQGAAAAITTADAINRSFPRMLTENPVRIVAVLPVMVDQRLQLTQATFRQLHSMFDSTPIQILPEIRSDMSVKKAERARKSLVEYDPKCRAINDYAAAAAQLLKMLQGTANAKTEAIAETQPA
jgi:chromosome partitioning protein